MLTSVTGTYENGQVILNELPPSQKKTTVVVTFLEEKVEFSTKRKRIGGLQGKVGLPEDFNKPLDDLKEYMS